MENNSIAKLIVGFLVLIVGIALITTITTSTIGVTQKTDIGSEALDIGGSRLIDPIQSINATYPFTIVNAPSGWKAYGSCPVTVFSMKNQTAIATTVTTDYVFFGDNGTLFLKNTTAFIAENGTLTANATTVAYTYCGDNYMSLAWGRAVLNLVVGFFALALLGVAVGLFYSVARDTGIISK
jgi:hypothetical protein